MKPENDGIGYPLVIIDDEQLTLTALKLALELKGYEPVHTFTTFDEARPFILSHQCRIILLDISMPGTSGIAGLEEIKKARPKFPVVMTTGTNDVSTAVRCIIAGASDYLLKPIEPDVLTNCVKSVLATHKGDKYLSKDDKRAGIPPVELAQRLHEVLIEGKLFLDPDIDVESLSLRLRSNRTYVSRIIGDYYKLSFRHLINELRVEEFLKLVDSPEFKGCTLDEISSKAGFVRKATFFEAFKEATGKTPAEWVRYR